MDEILVSPFSSQMLRLTSLSSLDSCIDQTLSASHGVEEELSWCQASQVGVLHKASTLRTVIIFNEVRQRAVFEAEGDSFTLHVLLPHHSDNLEKGGSYRGKGTVRTTGSHKIKFSFCEVKIVRLTLLPVRC